MAKCEQKSKREAKKPAAAANKPPPRPELGKK